MAVNSDCMANLQNFVQLTVKKVNEKAYKKLYNMAKEVAIQWEGWLALQFFMPKTGTVYRYKNRRGMMHHASSAGDYPADKTGALLDSIRVNLGSFNPNSKYIRIYLTSDAEHAKTVAKTRKLFQASKEEFFVKYFKDKLSNG